MAMEIVLPTVYFAFGGFLYLVVTIMHRSSRRRKRVFELLGLVVMYGLVLTFLATYHSVGVVHYFTPLAFTVGMFIILGFLYRRYLMPRLTETMVLVLTILFWYVFFRHDILHIPPLLILAGIPSLLAFITVFLGFQVPSWLKTILYVWSIVILITLAIALFQPERFTLLGSSVDSFMSGVELFLLGVSSFYVMSHSLLLWHLLPFPRDGQSHTEKREQIEKILQDMNDRFVDTQVHPLRAFILIGFLVVLAFSNYHLVYIGDELFVWGVLAIIPNLLYLTVMHSQKKPTS